MPTVEIEAPLDSSSERSSKSNTGDGLLIGIVVAAVVVLPLAALAWRQRRLKAQASKLFREHTANGAFRGGYAEPRPLNVVPLVAAPGHDKDDSDADGYLAVGAAGEAQSASSSSSSTSKSGQRVVSNPSYQTNSPTGDGHTYEVADADGVTSPRTTYEYDTATAATSRQPEYATVGDDGNKYAAIDSEAAYLAPTPTYASVDYNQAGSFDGEHGALAGRHFQ